MKKPFIVRVGVPICPASDKIGDESFFCTELVCLYELLEIKRQQSSIVAKHLKESVYDVAPFCF